MRFIRKVVLATSKESALSKLASIPALKGQQYANDKDYIPAKKFFKINFNRPYAKYWIGQKDKTGTIENVSIDDLIAGQSGLDRDLIASLIKSGYTTLPVVVRYKGLNYISDGHHRIVAAKLLGQHSVKVKLVELP